MQPMIKSAIKTLRTMIYQLRIANKRLKEESARLTIQLGVAESYIKDNDLTEDYYRTIKFLSNDQGVN